MNDAESLSDDYVASLLAKDAKESSIKYSALGMEAFLPSKVPVNKPKPNTRFLRAIITETDNHNIALLAKEAAESKARLQTLVKKDNRSGADMRRRQLGHITAHLTAGSPKRRRKDEDENKTGERKRKRDTDEEDANEKNHTRRREEHHDTRKVFEEDIEGRNSYHRSHRRHRSHSGERSRNSNAHIKDRSRARSRSPGGHRNRTSRRSYLSLDKKTPKIEDEDEGKNHRGLPRCRNTSALENGGAKNRGDKKKHESATSVMQQNDDDSDPLDDIIGPRPPPTPKIRSRGRGATSAASGIDLRFSSNYDPTVDVQMDIEEENDWDQALEALRDRQKWKAQGAERLRAAGFTDKEIEKWEKGGEKKEEDVRWAKRGESREWDKGKVFVDDIEDDLPNEMDDNYGRLKGN